MSSFDLINGFPLKCNGVVGWYDRLNNFRNFTVEIPGYTLSWIAMNRIGRRWALAGSLLLSALTCVAGGFANHGNMKLQYYYQP